MRADQLLVSRGFASTRSQAQRLIASGVRWRSPAGWCAVAKNGEELPQDAELALQDDAERRYVSRGGLKLEGALDHLGLDVAGLACLDVGQSTGGFTDVLLRRGARSVTGVDVGHGQLHASLRDDARVHAIEGVNARELSAAMLGEAMPEGGFDLLVCDVSFISITKLAAQWPALLGPEGAVVSLVKPQFEAGPQHVGKGGIVRDDAVLARVEEEVRHAMAQGGLAVHAYFPSAIQGGDGNREFFVHATRAAGLKLHAPAMSRAFCLRSSS